MLVTHTRPSTPKAAGLSARSSVAFSLLSWVGCGRCDPGGCQPSVASAAPVAGFLFSDALSTVARGSPGSGHPLPLGP